MRIKITPQYFVSYFDLSEQVRKAGFLVDIEYHLKNRKKPNRTHIPAQDGQHIDDQIATLCEQEKIEKKQLLSILVHGCGEQ